MENTERLVELKFYLTEHNAKILSEEMYKAGITADLAAETISELAKHLQPISEHDIFLVKMNPSMSAFQKWWIIRKMKKAIREREKMAK